mgnify:CR=1 FL=1|jgi:sulfhydrogenase subunit beta (sulfur reductase)
MVYQPIQTLSELPQGLRDQQSAGSYRLTETQNRPQNHRLFDWANGPQGLKPLLFPPQEPLWQADKGERGELTFRPLGVEQSPLAVIGVRGCDLAALSLMDRHFLREGAEDPWYQQRRQQLFLIAVECTTPAQSCFCASTDTGPAIKQDYDLRLHELDEGFLVDAGSAQGALLLQPLALAEATPSMVKQSEDALQRAAAQQQRAVATDDFRAIFAGRETSELWESIAEHCLACGNCTAVCPTCFCHREEDVSGLELQQSSHQRVWDSCFSGHHSQLHGVAVRSGRRERYRQWMSHKLAGWHDQFGESGCVGCGRCITWCPVGIDFVAESARFVEEQL